MVIDVSWKADRSLLTGHLTYDLDQVSLVVWWTPTCKVGMKAKYESKFYNDEWIYDVVGGKKNIYTVGYSNISRTSTDTRLKSTICCCLGPQKDTSGTHSF